MAIVLVVTSLVVASPDGDRQFTFAVRLMQQGERKLAEDAWNEFVNKYANDPRVPDAHYYMALLARQRGDLKAADAQLGMVVNPLHVTPEAVGVLRGQIKLESGDAAGAVGILEKIDAAKLPDAESKASWAYLLGVAYRGVGNMTGAAKQFDLASEAGSRVRGMALIELGKARIALNQPPAAIEALTAAVQTPDLDADAAAEARSLAADLAYSQKQYAMAADLYQQIIAHNQSSAYFKSALIGMLRSHYAAGQDAELLRQYDAVQKLLPIDAQAQALYLVAASQVRLEKYADAMKSLTDFFNRGGRDSDLADEAAYLYAVCYFHTDLPGFEKWIATVEAQLPKMAHHDQLQYLRAQAAVQLNKPAEAARYLAPLIDQPDNVYARQSLLQRAGLYEQLSEPDKAAADYALYSQRYGQDPKATEAGRRAIDLAFAAGKFDQVAELAQAWLMQKNLDATEAAPVQLRLALCLIKLGRSDGAMATLDKLLADKPPAAIDALAHYYRGLLLAGRASAPEAGRPDTITPALDELKAALAGALPADQQVEASSLAARLHRMAGRDDQAIAQYEDLRKRHSAASFDTPTALWVAQGLKQRGEHEASLAWALAVLDRKEESPDALAEAMDLAGEAYQKLGKFDEAVNTFRQLIAYSHGYGDQARLGLAQCLSAQNKNDAAMDEYDGLISAPASAIAAAALYESAMLRRDHAAALEKAGDQVKADAEREEARKRLHRVVILYDLPELAPLPVRAMMALGRMEADGGERDKARKTFESITQRADKSAWQTAAQAELLLVDGKRGDALFLMRKMLKDAPGDSAAAYVRERLGQLGETP